MPEEAVFVEGEAARALHIGGDARPLGDAVVERGDAWAFAELALGRLGEGIAEPLDDLEERQVGIGQPAADQVAVAFRVAGEDRFWSS